MAEVTMPRLSDTMQEGTIAKWLKQPGDPVGRGDVLAQVETDKATMDLTAFEAGTLQEILAPEGSTVPIGQAVARIGAGGGQPAPSPPAAVAPPAAGATGSEVPQAPEARAQAAEAPEPTQAPARTPTLTPSAETRRAFPPPDGAAGGKVRASPLARRIAEEHGVDLATVRGSGPEGRVIRVDVEAAMAAGRPAPAAPAAAPAPPAPAVAGPDEERVPLSQMRKTIARRMAESASTVPHFFLTTTVDASALVALRQQIVQQQEAAGEEVRVSLNDLVVRACAVALRRMPEVNVSFAGDALIRHHRVHVGIAVATERGLIVPVVRDADQKTVGQIAREARDLADRAREGKLLPRDYTGGTFSVSNLGMFGVEQFNAIINPPEAAILAVGAATREPAEHAGQVTLRDRMKLTLSVDHRALDGAAGARFLQLLKTLLEQPLLLLVE